MRQVALDCVFDQGEECSGTGRKQKEKTFEMKGWRGARQAQMIETFASREDQTAASAFVFVKSRPLTIVLSS